MGGFFCEDKHLFLHFDFEELKIIIYDNSRTVDVILRVA